MRILLTGKTGQVGRELSLLLAPLGELIAPDRGLFDLLDPESLRSKVREWKPDLIVNSAAYTAVDQAEKNANTAFTVNAASPMVIAQEASRLGIPLIHYSTDYVFDGKKESPYLEEDQPNPLNVYGESKLQGELNIMQYCDRYIVLRTSWVYSNCGSNFLVAMQRLFSEKEEVDVVYDQQGIPTSARMLAEVALDIINKIESSEDGWGLYHLSAKGQTSWYGFAEEILHRVKSKNDVVINKILSKDYGGMAIRPKNSVLDSGKLDSSFDVSRKNWESYLSYYL